MEILRSVRRLTNLEVVPGRELQETLDTCTGVLRSLSFEAVGKKHHYARKQSPFVFTGADELIDNSLGDVNKITELRFPKHECFWIVTAVAVFKSQYSSFRQSRVIDFAGRLTIRNMLEGHMFLFILNIDQNGVSLI